jgi:sialate O-acetylesterase
VGLERIFGVGYYFGREIRQATGKPVGLIESTWGGTPAQAWTSLSGLRQEPELQNFVSAYETTLANFEVANAAYPAKRAAFQKAVTAWKAAGGGAFEDKMKAWQASAQQAAAAGLPAPPDKPTFATPRPIPPPEPDGGAHNPTNLYNGMIAPLLPFAIKGAIWYQGESNAGAAAQYRVLFKRMIVDWREKWGEGDFPFFWVQLAGYKAGPVQNWPFLREAQAQTLVLPDTGMATAVDVGDPNNIHPTDKFDVGHRLALVAEDMVYGRSVADAGPVYAGMTKQGGTVTLRFSNVGGGLVIGKAPWAAPGVAPLPTDHLVGFTIAGPDKTFVPADAKIVGNTVVVSSAQQPLPEAVRYDWANAPEGNFYNADGMPAFPFRTDDWVDPVAMGTAPPAAKVK